MQQKRKIPVENIARISAGINGYYITAESADYIDERGSAYKTKADAQRAAKAAGFTHAVGSGAYGKINKLR